MIWQIRIGWSRVTTRLIVLRKIGFGCHVTSGALSVFVFSAVVASLVTGKAWLPHKATVTAWERACERFVSGMNAEVGFQIKTLGELFRARWKRTIIKRFAIRLGGRNCTSSCVSVGSFQSPCRRRVGNANRTIHDVKRKRMQLRRGAREGVSRANCSGNNTMWLQYEGVNGGQNSCGGLVALSRRLKMRTVSGRRGDRGEEKMKGWRIYAR